ncbi:MAG: NAD(+)/NADH kinase [Chloroflexi bacterium]|nr:NAD(+)/NADH kinase [Chloroflexota bacterium]
MKKAGILFNARIAAAKSFAPMLQENLEKEGISIWSCAASDEARARAKLSGTKIILSLGGDGTMLRVARLAAQEGIPILGINMGNLGFTTELTADGALERIPNFLTGEGWIDERAMLQVELPLHGDSSTYHALNDVVVARGSTVRVIKVRAAVSGQPMTTYRADGVIVATATGSTGYSLAAGGPILFPNAKEFLLTPISPHLGLSAALVLSPDAVVELDVQTAHEARVSIDGQVELPLRSVDTIRVTRSPYTTKLLRIQPQSFFYQTLLERLGGKGG